MADAKAGHPSSMMTPADLAARFHKVLSNPLRHEIVMRTGARPWSPTELADASGRSLKHVYKAIEDLKKEGLIELVGKEPGPKGGLVHRYRAVARFMVNAEEWDELSDLERAAATCKIVAELEGDMHDALDAGTFWGKREHCLIRDHRRVDSEGMKKCDEILRRAYGEIVKAEEASVERSRENGEPTFLMVTGLMAFAAGPQTPSPRR